MNDLQTFANGDTNYISKHNANYANIKSAVEALEANMAAQVAAASGPGSAFDALFGPTSAIIGAESYAATGSGETLTVAAGFAWKPSLPKVVRNPAPATLLFAGLAVGTYYIYADQTGAPVRNSTAGVEDLYSVVWTGSSFGDITRLAPVVWGAADDFAAQDSTALGQTFAKLDDRLEAGEAASAAGALARTWQTGRLSKDVSGGADVTLTDVEANNTLLNLTGTLTANINVIVPLGTAPRLWVVTNNTTGAYTVTVKGATGAGIAVAQAGEALLSQDGTNVFLAGGGGSGAVKSINTKTPDGSGAVTLTASDVGAVATSALGAAGGAASLDGSGKLPTSQLPNLAIIDFLGTVADQTAMLALSGQKGDWCARSDTSTVYVITSSDPTQISSWTALSYPTGTGGTVTSVSLTTPGLLFNVSGSPVTGSGTLGMTLKTQVKNTFLAGPTTGADATPTMRALVAADMAALLAAVNVFTKNQCIATVSLGSGVSPAIDASLSNNFKITLTANNTLVNPTNLTEGMTLNFAITQDATGSRTLSYGSLYKFPGGTAPTLSTAANAKDFMSCYYDGSILLCQMNKGYA